jgi:hypothetical protein
MRVGSSSRLGGRGVDYDDFHWSREHGGEGYEEREGDGEGEVHLGVVGGSVLLKCVLEACREVGMMEEVMPFILAEEGQSTL